MGVLAQELAKCLSGLKKSAVYALGKGFVGLNSSP